MRRSVCFLGLGLLCGAFASVDGHQHPAQGGLLRPPDDASTDDGHAVEEPLAMTSKPSSDFAEEHVLNTMPQTTYEKLTLLRSDASNQAKTTGSGCALTSQAKERYTTSDGRKWLVDDAVLKEVDNDLQMIMNCTQEGDVVSLDVTNVIKPSSLVTIPWRLTISSDSKDNCSSKDTATSKTRTRFTCPRENTGIFLVQAKSVTFADLVIEECTFDGTDESQSLIEVSECHDRDSPGLVVLRSVAFRKNRLVGASALRMSESSCFELAMIDVEISDNVCSNDGCGVLLAKESNLENCIASGNKMVKSNKEPSSLLYVPASSNTTIQGFEASRNDLALIRVQDGGVLSLSNASFDQNSLKRVAAKRWKISCIHLVKSFASIRKCSFTANKGFRGTAIFAQKSVISVSGSVFRDNIGSLRGGCIYARKSEVTLKNTAAINSSAKNDGGFMYMLNSNATLENTTAINSSAKNDGGFMYMLNSNATLENTTAINSSAKNDGGFINAWDSNVTLENTTAINSSAKNDGGFMLAYDSTVKLESTTATNSSAEFGGFMSVFYSNATLENTTAINSSAKNDGGFMRAYASTVKLESTTATGNSAEYKGGFMSVFYSNATLENTTAINSSAKNDGGFMRAYDSTVKLEDTTATNSRAEFNGGFMYVEDSTVKLEDTTATNSSAEYGGFMHVTDSTVTLESTTATKSSAKSDGRLFFVCSENRKRCLINVSACPFMALTNSKFSDNEAKAAGGAVFAGYSKAVRFDCSDTSADKGLEFCKEEWKALSRLKSEADICPSWKDNQSNVYGPEVGTYAATANMTMKKAKRSVCVSGEKACVIDGYRTSKDLPKAREKPLDGLGQGPAIGIHTINAVVSSAKGEFMVGSVVLPMEEGSWTFQSIRGFVPPGKYRLKVEFDDEVIEDIRIAVSVRDCFIGEIVDPTTGICQECSNKTYSFDPSTKECLQCPENGNCESRAITPDDGYWQKTPCSRHIHRCLPTSSCKRENRSKKLTDLVGDATSCNFFFGRSFIKKYTEAQCAEGHEGVLCGSCTKGHGTSLSSKCRECLKGFFNVAYIVASALFLLVLTGITIRGTLSALRGTAEQRRVASSAPSSSSSSSSEGIESPLLGTEEETIDEVPASDEVLAKWKTVEMFKITLSYVQVTVLLAALDVGWAIPLIVMAELAELVGGLASDGIRRSVVCLSSGHPLSLHPTALAFVINLCVIPAAVFLVWAVFWAVKLAKHGSERPPRYLEKRCALSLMVIWYITLVPVLKTALSVFLCVDVHDEYILPWIDETHKYWVVDTALKCYEGDHSKLLYSLVVSFVCPLYGGLLFLFVVFLKNPIPHLSYKRGWAFQTMGFLYRSYRLDTRRFWEVAIVVRKAGIAFLVFCAHLFDSTLPITGVANLITVAIVAQILAAPYRRRFRDLNRFELASLFVSQVTTHAASMLKDEHYPENYTRELLTAACVLLNLITFFVFVFYLLKFAAEYLRQRLEARGVNLAPGSGVFGVLKKWISYEIEHLIAKLRLTPEDREDPETAEQSALED